MRSPWVTTYGLTCSLPSKRSALWIFSFTVLPSRNGMLLLPWTYFLAFQEETLSLFGNILFLCPANSPQWRLSPRLISYFFERADFFFFTRASSLLPHNIIKAMPSADRTCWTMVTKTLLFRMSLCYPPLIGRQQALMLLSESHLFVKGLRIGLLRRRTHTHMHKQVIYPLGRCTGSMWYGYMTILYVRLLTTFPNSFRIIFNERQKQWISIAEKASGVYTHTPI